MTPDQIVAFVLALAAPPAAQPSFPLIAAGGPDPRYPVQAVACSGSLAPHEVEGVTVACGTVSVPEDHDKPDGRRIDLSFMVLQSHSTAPAADPVVCLHGGPGGGIVRDPMLISRFLNGLRDRRTVVAFDQRSVMTSAGPQSRCHATVANPDTLVQAASGDGTEAGMLALGRKAIRACLDEIAASGADISTINTLRNARDVEALMQALGRNSSGPGNQGITGYVPRMIAALEHGEVTTLVELSAHRPGRPTTAATALAGLSGLDADTQRLAEAALKLAEISDQAVQDALAGLEAARHRAVRGTGLVDVFDASLGDAAKALPDPPARLAFGSDHLLLRASDPSPEALDALLAKHFGGATLAGLRALTARMTADQIAQVFDRVGSDNSGIDDMLVGQFDLQMFACQEDMEISGPATIPIASARLREEFGWPEDLLAELEKGMDMAMYGPCTEFERHPGPGMNDPVASDIPTLVLQGTLDTQTASSRGPMLVSTLPKGQLAMLPESGHGTFIFPDCARDMAAAILDTPDAPVDTACTADLVPGCLLPDGTWSR